MRTEGIEYVFEYYKIDILLLPHFLSMGSINTLCYQSILIELVLSHNITIPLYVDLEDQRTYLFESMLSLLWFGFTYISTGKWKIG